MDSIQVNEQRLVDNFCKLVRIDSSTGMEKLIAEELKRQLADLGAAVREDDAGTTFGGNCGNLIAKIPGTKPGPTLLLSAHMDRVEPGQGINPVITDGIIRSQGDTILAADDVAGIAEILEALRVIKENQLPHVPVEVVFTVAEEGGLKGAKALDTQQLESTMGFMLDGGGPVGTVTVQAPAQTGITATFHGKSAHAGIAPEKGINALVAAALAVAKMKLGRIDEVTTANIGVLTAGQATNIVPDRAVLKGEARSRNPEKLLAQVEHMVACINEACSQTGATVDLDVVDSYPAFQLGEQEPVVELITTACKQAGIPVQLVGSGGGSDANIINGKGIPCVVLGMGYEDVHSTNESIPTDQLVKGAQLIATLLQIA